MDHPVPDGADTLVDVKDAVRTEQGLPRLALSHPSLCAGARSTTLRSEFSPAEPARVTLHSLLTHHDHLRNLHQAGALSASVIWLWLALADDYIVHTTRITLS